MQTLDLLHDNFLVPLQNALTAPKRDVPTLDRKTITSLYGNLAELRGVNREFLYLLRRRLRGTDRLAIGDVNNTEQLSDVFLRYVPFMKVYAVYLKNYPNALSVLANLTSTNAQFRSFV